MDQRCVSWAAEACVMIQSLDRAWRLIATALSFAIFGIGGLVLAIVIFPLVNLLVVDAARRERLAQKIVQQTWWLYIRIMRGLGVLTFECHGVDQLRQDRGTVIVANHPSLLDIVFIISLIPQTRCVVKEGVWRNVFMRGAVRATNYIPNLGDPERLISDCAAALRHGANLVIFPEGSRTSPNAPRRFQRGFAHVALRAMAPIRLVTVRCDPPTLRKGEPWYSIPRRRPHWVLRVHDRIDMANVDLDPEPALAVRKLSTRIETNLRLALEHE